MNYLLPIVLLFVWVNARAQDISNPAGIWIWASPATNDFPRRTNVLSLYFKDGVVSGTIETSGSTRLGAQTPISEAKVEGSNLTFTVVRRIAEASFAQKYTGYISNDTIAGEISYEQNGQKRSVMWKARRDSLTTSQPTETRKSSRPRRGRTELGISPESRFDFHQPGDSAIRNPTNRLNPL